MTKVHTPGLDFDTTAAYPTAIAELNRLREVNAHLLAALEAVVLAGGAKETTKWRMICMLDHARAAIAKAKGGEA